MAKKNLNDRCPLQGECEKKTCSFSRHELDCPYYDNNSRPGYEIPDQEEKRRERWREGDFSYLDEDGLEDAESPSAAEIAAVAPLELTEDILPPVEVLPPPVSILTAIQALQRRSRRLCTMLPISSSISASCSGRCRSMATTEKKVIRPSMNTPKRSLASRSPAPKNFIAINYEFGCRDDRPRGISHQRTMSLQPQYKQFKYSQLCEMLSMSDKQREKVTPDMTVKQIRDLKRGEAEPDLPPNMETIPIPLPDDAPDSGQTSGQLSSRHSHTVNNIWMELPADFVKSLVAVSGLRYNPKSYYDITIKLHKG